MKTPFFRTPYNYDRDKASDEHGLYCADPSLAQQQFKDECDLNVMFSRYLETGEMPQITDVLNYTNFEGPFDFMTAMNTVRAAQEQFEQLPARIKNRFDNNPQKLLDFLDDERNRDEAIFLELVNRTPRNPEGTPRKGEPATEGQPKPDPSPGKGDPGRTENTA